MPDRGVRVKDPLTFPGELPCARGEGPELNEETDCLAAKRFKSSVLPAASERRCKASWVLVMAGDNSSTAVRFIMGCPPYPGTEVRSLVGYVVARGFLDSKNCLAGEASGALGVYRWLAGAGAGAGAASDHLWRARKASVSNDGSDGGNGDLSGSSFFVGASPVIIRLSRRRTSAASASSAASEALRLRLVAENSHNLLSRRHRTQGGGRGLSTPGGLVIDQSATFPRAGGRGISVLPRSHLTFRLRQGSQA